MIRITEQIKNFPDFHDFLGYNPETSLFFDIETTGLSPASSVVFLIGTVHRTGGSWKFTQYLCERPDEEYALLKQFLEDAAPYETLIHFNGSTFDLPYLAEKAKAYDMCPLIDRSGGPNPDVSNRSVIRRSIDLYQTFRPLKKLLGLDCMNQTSLEQFIGWQREDRLTGRHMIKLFQGYAKTAEPLSRELLLLHNHDDLIGMTRILALSSYIMLFSGDVKDVLAELTDDRAALQLSFRLPFPLPGDPVLPSACPVKMEQPLSSTGLTKTEQPLSDPSLPKTCQPLSGTGTSKDFSLPSCCTLSVHRDQGTLSVPLYTGELRHFFPDHKNYYYLPLEDQAVHKSVGQFIDSDYRTPAKPANCYVRKSGMFLPQPEELFAPAFREAVKSAPLFFEYTESFPESEMDLQRYTAALLRSFPI